MNWLTKNMKESILFFVGILILLFEVFDVILRNDDVHSAFIVLGLTLCGVGAIKGLNNGQK